MPTFTGTNREFKRYIGPRLRNLVHMITQKHKAAVGACEHCGVGENLESAHLKGKDRNQIIDLLLSTVSDGSVLTVDLQQFEARFESEHDPVEKAILILCRSCHGKYDSNVVDGTPASPAPKVPNQGSGITAPVSPRIDPQVAPSHGLLPIALDPPRAADFKRQLLDCRRATITTYYNDGRVQSRPWDASRFTDASNVMRNLRSRPEFRQGTWQAAGIVKVLVSVLAADA